MYSNEEEGYLLRSTNREEVAASIKSSFQEVRKAKTELYDYSNIRSTIDDPETVPLESVDLFVAPHMQQGRITNEYVIEKEIVTLVAFRMRSRKRKG